MNDLSIFSGARPAMIVGKSFAGHPAPLDLDKPFALVGGEKLADDGVGFELMHEHQPDFLKWVAESCHTSLAAGRDWFHGSAVSLSSGSACGPLHAARTLAHVIGAPHVILDLANPSVANSLASSKKIGEDGWATPLTVAMAAHRCANPVASVVNFDRVTDDVLVGLFSMIDPNTSSLFTEDKLRVTLDLSQVTWMIQQKNAPRASQLLAEMAEPMHFNSFPTGRETTAVLSILLEVIRDLDLDASDPALDWSKIAPRLDGHHSSASGLYDEMRRAVIGAERNEVLPPWRTVTGIDTPLFLNG